ncbi:putative rRNA methyltransferase [Forsythia ovata]|uniref:rRNA methyltransferase n=1 Tax=Forsythia ovata TaxID=205694 RepID=A0ABD1RSD6_9LAMI
MYIKIKPEIRNPPSLEDDQLLEVFYVFSLSQLTFTRKNDVLNCVARNALLSVLNWYVRFGQGDDNNMVHSDLDSDNDEGDREVNPFVVPLLENAPSHEEIAAKWFSQDVFMDADVREDEM